MNPNTAQFPIPAQQFIPQKQPIIMIDNVLSFSEEEFETDFVISKDNIFVENGVFRECGLIENIAQTCAAFIGFPLKGRSAIPIGVIGGIKDFTATELPKAGTGILTRIRPLITIDTARVISAEIIYNEKVIATCTLKVFIDSHHNDRK